jgi:hypothetical protein
MPRAASLRDTRDGAGVAGVVVVALYFLLTFRTLQFFPHAAVLREMWIVAVGGLLLLVYLPDVAGRAMRITRFEVFVLTLLVCPFVAAYQASQVFGQPFLHGLLAGRGIVLVGAAPLLVLMLRRRVVGLDDVERALVGLAWLSLVGYVALAALADPADFAAYDTEFVTGAFAREAAFKFDSAFVVLGFFYYALPGPGRMALRRLAMALPFLLYLVLADGGRSMLISLGITYAVLSLRWSGARSRLGTAAVVVVLAALPLGLLYAIDPARFDEFVGRMWAALAVVFTGEPTSDPSANARVYETLLAWPYLAEHWLLGNGLLSRQWQDSYTGALGYFYPADIGLLGVVFSFGVLGALLFGAQFALAVGLWRRLFASTRRIAPFAAAIGAYLLYYAIRSLANGAFAYGAETGLLLIAVLYWMSRRQEPGGTACVAAGHGLRAA